MKRLLSIALILALSGCAATGEWKHSYKSQVAYDKDSYQCGIEAGQRTANTGFAGNPIIASQFWDECMGHRGWRYVQSAPTE
jgi:hypothetical protein